MLPMLQGPAGQRWAPNRDPWGILHFGMYVTDKCKDPELAVAMYDYMMNREIMLGGIPMKGISWDNPDPGALGIGGGPALYKSLLDDTRMPLNSYWDVQRPYFGNKEYIYGRQASNIDAITKYFRSGDPSLVDAIIGEDYLVPSLIIGSNSHVPYEIPQKYFIPPVALNDTDNKRVADINAVLGSYKDQAIAEFVTGVRDINNNADWNAYLADLDRIGSKDLVAIYQKYIK
jgi:putative aldouronate transport system substrate-binding protein